jgi:hypothetical protein
MIVLVGGSASTGKTTLSAALADRLGIDDVVHLDDVRPDHPDVAFLDRTEGIWTLPIPSLLDAVLRACRAVHPVITELVETRTDVIIEGEGVEPSLAAGFESVRVGYVIETDGAALERTFLDRPSSAAFLALSDAERAGVVGMNRVYGEWLQGEAERLGQPWVPAQPWDTLPERFLAAIGL